MTARDPKTTATPMSGPFIVPSGRRRRAGSLAVAFALASLPRACARQSRTVAFVVDPCRRRLASRRTHARRRTFATRSSTSSRETNCGEDRPSHAARIDDVHRIFAISDLHTDSEANMQWLIDRCTLPAEQMPTKPPLDQTML